MSKTFKTFHTPKERAAKGLVFIALFGAITLGFFSPFAIANADSSTSVSSSQSSSQSSSSDSSTSTSTSSSTSLTSSGDTSCAVGAGMFVDNVSDVTPKVGETISYEIEATLALTTPTTVSVTSVVPTGLAFVSANTSNGTFSSSTETWNVGTLNDAPIITLDIKAKVQPGTEGKTIKIDPNVNYVQSNCTKSSAVAGATITVQSAPVITPTSTPAVADISITKIADVTSTVEGGTINYTVAVKDLGPATSTGVVATDVLPSGLMFVSETSSVGSYATGTGIWTIGNLSANQSATLSIAAKVNTGTASSTITNTATVKESASSTDSNMANNSSSVSIPVIAVSHPAQTGSITVCKVIENASGTIVDGSATIAGETFTVPGAVENHITSTLLQSTTLTAPLSLNTKLFGASANNAQCVTYSNLPLGSYYYGQEVIGTSTSLWAEPMYNDQENMTATSTSSFFRFVSDDKNDGTEIDVDDNGHDDSHDDDSATSTVNVNADGDIPLTASHSARELIVLNKFLGAPVITPTPTPSADLSISKTADVTSTTEGGTINYTLTAKALGPATSTGVVATDVLPAGLSFVSATSSVGSYATSTGAWTIGNLSASSTAILNIVAKVNTGTAGTTIANTGSIKESTSTVDNNLSNNSSTVVVNVQPNVCTSNCGGGGAPSADLSISKTADVTSTTEGGTINYTVKVKDLGPATSTGVVATDVLPSTLTLVSATPSVGTFATSTGAWTIGALSASSTATLTIAAKVKTGTASSTITNTAIVTESTSETDSNSSNNSSSATVAITPNVCTSNCGGGGNSTSTDLAITKTVDNASPVAGATVNYTVTVTDLGPATSTFVVSQDQLPAGLSLVSATTSQGSYNMSTGVWNIGTLGANGAATLRVATVVSVAEAGQAITNTATVSSTLGSFNDPNSANNSASVTINVQPAICTVNCGGGGGGGGGGGNVPLAEIGIAKTVDNANPNVGDTIHYTVTVSATGPATSLGVVATDVLPAGVTLVSATPSEGSYASSTGIWTIGTLNAGHNATLVITATVNAGTNGQTIANIGTVTESRTVNDQNSTNNTASATITVGGSGGGGGNGGGGGGGGGGTGGQVLGASCGLYLTGYIHPNRKGLNDPVQVKKLQSFLNQNLGLNLPVDGNYSSTDIRAVDQFQVKYSTDVLAPWVPLGLPSATTPTGYVYQTTQRWINLIMCPPLNLPIPTLVVDQGGA